MYLGRFAPSPTGPLHFGSLVAALASFLDARAAGGKWLLRIEDVDEPRTVPGAAEQIVDQLGACGLVSDGPVLFQSQRTGRYEEVLEVLRARGEVFPCACTRKEMADSALAADGSRRYPGTCRLGLPPGRVPRAWRLRTSGDPIQFRDRVQGVCAQDLEAEVGDFVVRRADGLFAYQLAVVVDDADQGITDVVRGADLLGSTARQLYLQRLLGVTAPRYAHLPIALNAAGEKLSKQTLAVPFDSSAPTPTMLAALRFLGQAPPANLYGASPRTVLDWAIANWSMSAVPRVMSLPAPA